MPELALLDHDTVLAAVSPAAAIDATRDGLPAPPLRRVGHAGEGLPRQPAVRRLPSDAGARRRPRAAEVGHVVSRQPAQGLPTVSGVVCLSDARTGVPLAILDARAVTALRTGAVAAVASLALARPDARSVGIVGCGLHGAWTARCLAAAGYDDGVCFDPRAEAAAALADELGWSVGDLPEALACEIVSCITPGSAVVVERDDLAPGQHLNMLGADGSGKAEASIEAVAGVRAVLRRVGAGLARGRAGRRGRGGPRRAGARSRRSARCSPATRPAAAARTPRRSSTPRGWRSRISPSPPPRCARRSPARCRRAASGCRRARCDAQGAIFAPGAPRPLWPGAL